jgi:hypothetical protein
VEELNEEYPVVTIRFHSRLNGRIYGSTLRVDFARVRDEELVKMMRNHLAVLKSGLLKTKEDLK